MLTILLWVKLEDWGGRLLPSITLDRTLFDSFVLLQGLTVRNVHLVILAMPRMAEHVKVRIVVTVLHCHLWVMGNKNALKPPLTDTSYRQTSWYL